MVSLFSTESEILSSRVCFVDSIFFSNAYRKPVFVLRLIYTSKMYLCIFLVGKCRISLIIDTSFAYATFIARNEQLFIKG